MKTPDTTLILTSIICLLPIIPGLLLWDQLPDQLAIHWNAAGEPDNFGPKTLVVFGLPLLLCALNLIVRLRQSADQTPRMLGTWLIPVISLILVPVTLLSGLGVGVPVTVIVSLLIGALLIIIGHSLPQSEPNSSFGIRLPWTLASAEIWNRTHHLAEYLWILGGILLILSPFLPKPCVIPAVAVVLILIIVIPAAYSFSLHRKIQGGSP